MLNAPILLIAFNRPETTKAVLDKIKQAKPAKLYVAIDGPRPDHQDEEKLVREVIKLIEEIDWVSNINTNYNTSNKGAEITVSSAVSWVLEKEEYIIVMEDDIIAPVAFFKYAEQMLMRYKDDERVAMISGCNYTPINLKNDFDYLFGIYGHTWGWATWRRSWKKFSLYITDIDDYLNENFIRSISHSRKELKYISNYFKRLKRIPTGQHTWDNCWFYYRLTHNKLSIIPRVNLISNIGVHGLHARGKTKHHYRDFDQNYIANKHPDKVERNIDYDTYHIKKQLSRRTPLHKRIINKIKRSLFVPINGNRKN